MTNNPKDGGAAFPCCAISSSGDEIWQEGMSLRDWFAGQALASISDPCLQRGGGYSKADCIAAIVNTAYDIADAMLAQSQKGTDDE